MIRIMFFIPELSGGGAEKVLANLVNNMDQSKFDITVCTYSKCDYKNYLVNGIHYKYIEKCHVGLGQKLFRYWYRFCTEIGLTYSLYIKDDYDIEVAYLETEATKVMASSTNQHALKVAWVHCDLEKKGSTAKKSGKYYAKYDKVVCVSDDVKKAYDKIFGNYASAVVLPNVLDEDEIISNSKEQINIDRDPNKNLLVAVGRLSPEKNYKLLINVCHRLILDGYPIQLIIVGEGAERACLENLIHDFGMECDVRLVGFQKNPYPWMKAADYVVCSSLYEGSSTVVQEALILGKIVITTPCGGMKDLLGSSEFGIIADDYNESFYNSLKLILGDETISNKYYEAVQKKSKMISKNMTISLSEHFFIRQLEWKEKQNG